MHTIGFLGVPEASADAQKLFNEDTAESGYVMNVSRLWAYQPATVTGLSMLLGQVNSEVRLSLRERSILVAACASAFGDSYCSLACMVARDPNATTAADVQALRDVGCSDSKIFTITVFVALRLAFSTVNDALGLRPDAALRSTAPGLVRDAVTFGRPIEDEA